MTAIEKQQKKSLYKVLIFMGVYAFLSLMIMIFDTPLSYYLLQSFVITFMLRQMTVGSEITLRKTASKNTKKS